MNLSRRQSFRLLAGSVVSTSAVVGAVPLVAAATKVTAQERYDFHLAELQKAAAEINPMISYWYVDQPDEDSQNRAIVLIAYQDTGRYEGDGRYEAANPSWNGKHSIYNVKLMDYRIDGERVFHVSTPMERRWLTEPCFNTSVGRKIGEVP
ncbi:hypothetical protein [Rhizobium rhizogenes]|uniref:hypothetical protein n=1 Tax=Rhizobium rhizogenes TaxID=359 RepID=UPI00157246DA|nr:hypothetical protein [Rhizobium rhizogenes]NTG09234.1 hypothetical protein [Rhizobium rhizogenes]